MTNVPIAFVAKLPEMKCQFCVGGPAKGQHVGIICRAWTNERPLGKRLRCSSQSPRCGMGPSRMSCARQFKWDICGGVSTIRVLFVGCGRWPAFSLRARQGQFISKELSTRFSTFIDRAFVVYFSQ